VEAFLDIGEPGEGNGEGAFRNINEDKAWGTVWFKDGKPSAFQYYQKIGAKK
jgi:hypothetical protein